jgi:hypothetical protein
MKTCCAACENPGGPGPRVRDDERAFGPKERSMYYPLASKLVVVNGVDQFLPWVPMRGGNAVQIEATVFANTATSLSLVLEGSNDQQNPTTITSNTGLVLGYGAPAKSTQIACQFVRLKATVVGTGTVIVACGLNVAAL